MPKRIKLGVVATSVLLLLAGLTVAGSYAGRDAIVHEPSSPASHFPEGKIFAVAWTSSAPALAPVDVEECNDYAGWIAEREAHLDRIAAEGRATDIALDRDRFAPGSISSVGTLEGLSKMYRDDPRAAVAYRRCMVRRGYNTWG